MSGSITLKNLLKSKALNSQVPTAEMIHAMRNCYLEHSMHNAAKKKSRTLSNE